MGSMPTPLRVAIVKAYDLEEPKHRGMVQSFRDNIRRHVPDALVDAYQPMADIRDLPEPANYDLIIITGGLSNLCQAPSCYEPWVNAVLEWIRGVVSTQPITRTKLMGVCWGHQAIATALSGSIGSFEFPRVGVEELPLNQDGQALFGKNSIKITKFHKRFVKDVPAGFRPLAPDNEILFADSGLVLSMQGHPEIQGELARQLFDHDVAYYRQTLPTEEDLQRYFAQMNDSKEDGELIFKKVAAWAAS
ncbi:Glutamine amidotransferase-like protein chyE [Colletotrichum tropicale]|uniref:Glutamine amidotransferase-like protein chyE n=1 Tax=Colletotrichum siamense TaxID=690259 RepID=UPI0018728961|nr:Glutamine amidotransferase-like protein chyE [Colletotrichum siamense]XP_037185079.1 Glutamine amidotransferase-like protein chyE [Colletotrichum aenigma]KAF4831080.1 Glutamine amidotransferase-like protein chyE [Colletotrichum tropicale]KAI8316972.1 Glutamine amidotransferase-like protein chyE [Colletotrichum sp. SAR11_240]KAF5517131.1 Glutamine amidotransferase-like protein chyE [Colletotrichum siamense]KAF5527445.1 Glutamine amidotransferase-like protein chyE [Colletotrichum aenigma]